MKLEMNFYLITTLSQYFPEHFNGFDINKTAYKSKLNELKINKSFYETDKETECNARFLKVCGECTPSELIEWEQFEYFVHSCDTMGALTLEYGLLGAISLEDESTDYPLEHDEIINSYVSPNPNIINGDPDKITDLMRNKVNSWIDEWFEWVKDIDRDNEQHPSVEFFVDENQLELAL